MRAEEKTLGERDINSRGEEEIDKRKISRKKKEERRTKNEDDFNEKSDVIIKAAPFLFFGS